MSKNNSVKEKKRDPRISDENLENWSKWLPRGYEDIVVEKVGLSKALIRRVKSGRSYNIQLVTAFNGLCESNKKRIAELKNEFQV